MSVESTPLSASFSSEMVPASIGSDGQESPSILPTGNNDNHDGNYQKKKRKKKNPQRQHSSPALPATTTPAKKIHNTTTLSKQENGRLKKLLKRASLVDTSNAVSGIVQYSEWRELQVLWQKSSVQRQQQHDTTSSRRCDFPPAPRLSWKRGGSRGSSGQQQQADPIVNKTDNNQPASSDPVIDAASHRDLLRRLVLTRTTQHEEDQKNHNNSSNSSNNNKKRKRASTSRKTNSTTCDGSSDRSFAWVSLHNPFAVTSVGVLELHVDTVEAVEWLQQKLQDLIGSSQHHVVTTTTSWFQPSRVLPQAIADRLLYKPPNASVKLQTPDNETSNDDDCNDAITTKRCKTDEPTTMSTLQSLVERMNLLILTRKELEQNGYPFTATLTQQQADINGNRNPGLWDHAIRPQDISLAEAMAFVLDYQTKTETMDPQIQLPPYVMAPSGTSSSQSVREQQVFAMDAEMVETHAGRELARITLVRLQPPPPPSLSNESHKEQQSSPTNTTHCTDLVFDVLVRPRNVVTNYWTQYSGVTAAMLHDDDPSTVVVQLEQVQAALLRTIHPDDILVGHSLENDLKATRFLHEKVVDTAVIFQKQKGKKMALRHLAAVLLNRCIQQSDRAHCSEEDALASLQLAVRRAIEGPSFTIHSSPTPTNWLAELSSSSFSNSPNTVVTIGPSEWLERHVLSAPPNGVHALQCDSMHDSNAQALESWLTGPRRRAAVVYASFCLPPASHSRNRTSVLSSSSTEAPLHLPDVNKLIERVTSLLQKLPPEAILLFAIQPGYNAAHQRTQLRTVRRNNPKATLGVWTESEEEEWRRLVQSCRMGSVLWVSSK